MISFNKYKFSCLEHIDGYNMHLHNAIYKNIRFSIRYKTALRSFLTLLVFHFKYLFFVTFHFKSYKMKYFTISNNILNLTNRKSISKIFYNYKNKFYYYLDRKILENNLVDFIQYEDAED